MMQMQQNPELRAQVKNNPMVKAMLEDPDQLKAMWESNPMLKQMMGDKFEEFMAPDKIKEIQEKIREQFGVAEGASASSEN